jgi:uncharacterized protein (TIGR03792 family)
VFLLLVGLPGDAFGASLRSTGNDNGGVDLIVVEHLRVKVPAAARSAWLQAERETWEPWLRRQSGCLGRELLWDGATEEGILMIRWSSRSQWLAIPQAEIDSVQRQFETVARRALGIASQGGVEGPAHNPFPLVYAGELQSMTPPPLPAAPEEP